MFRYLLVTERNKSKSSWTPSFLIPHNPRISKYNNKKVRLQKSLNFHVQYKNVQTISAAVCILKNLRATRVDREAIKEHCISNLRAQIPNKYIEVSCIREDCSSVSRKFVTLEYIKPWFQKEYEPTWCILPLATSISPVNLQRLPKPAQCVVKQSIMCMLLLSKIDSKVMNLHKPSIERKDCQTSRSSVKVVDKTIRRLLISNQNMRKKYMTITCLGHSN